MNMTSENNKALVRRFYEEIVNTGKVDNIEDFIAPDYTEVQDGKRFTVGIGGCLGLHSIG